MWSGEVTGRRGPLAAAQRALFPVDDGTEETRRRLLRALKDGRCRGVALADVGDAHALRLVRTALEAAWSADDEAAGHRGQVAIVAMTAENCSAHELLSTVENALATLRTGRIDVLLLSARSPMMPEGTEHALFARKRLLIEYWSHMIQLQEAGMVTHLGVSGFSIQDVELLMESFPADIPAIFGILITAAQTSVPAQTRSSLQTFKGFAHGAGMDLLVRFSFSDLDDLELAKREQWTQTWQSIRQRHKEMEFQHLVTHELEKCAEFHTEKTTMGAVSETNDVEDEPRENVASPLGSPSLIVLRYFLQLGLIVIPVVENSVDDLNIEDVIFSTAIHPFADLHPAYSPHKAYSSILAEDELKAIQRDLGFIVPSPQENKL